MGVYLLGSKHLRVGLDSSSRVKEVHFPLIGLDNHIPGSLYHRIGVYVDGRLSWVDNQDGWRISRKTSSQALIPHTVAENRSLGITLEFIDAVDDTNSSLLRNIHVINLHANHREVKLFMHQGFIFRSNSYDEGTGSYSPEHRAIVHYGRGVAFAAKLSQVDGDDFSQHTIGKFGSSEFMGTYMDALDGQLERCDHENGMVDSTMSLSLQVAPMGSLRASYILAASHKPDLALKLVQKVSKFNMAKRIQQIADEWRTWLKPAIQVIDRIEEPLQATFLTSLMSIRAHIDTSGALLTYRPNGEAIYSSPRIAGYALWPLIRLGYKKEAEQYFNFMRSALSDEVGVKSFYSSVGYEGYSPFPLSTEVDGKLVRPIELDNAAMLVFMFTQLHSAHPSKKLLESYYESFVVPLLDNLADQLDRTTGLPLPSYSLLSRSNPTQSTFTASLVYAALVSGADLAEVKRDAVRAVGWRSVADEIFRGINVELIKTDVSSILQFAGQQKREEDQHDIHDLMSSYGLFIYGLMPSHDSFMAEAYDGFKNRYGFGVDGRYAVPVGGLSTFGESQEDFPVAALWCAQYAAEVNNEGEALSILRWVRDVYLEPYSRPVTKETRKASELSYLWTQAEFISTILDLITEPGESD